MAALLVEVSQGKPYASGASYDKYIHKLKVLRIVW